MFPRSVATELRDVIERAQRYFNIVLAAENFRKDSGDPCLSGADLKEARLAGEPNNTRGCGGNRRRPFQAPHNDGQKASEDTSGLPV